MSQNLIDRFVNAATTGNKELGEKLIAEGVNVNGRLSGRRDYTALITAAYGGHLSFVEMLLQNGADPGLVWEGKNAKAWAADNNKTDVMEFINSWKSKSSPEELAQKKDQVVICSAIGSRTLEEVFNFAARERISMVCDRPGAPVQTILREPFSAIEDQSGIETAFKLYKEYGGKLTVDDVFPGRVFKAKMPKIGGAL
jgi:hypothetical protein